MTKMTIEERKLSIALQVANNANSLLVANLAQALEEIENLKTEIAKLKEANP